MTFGQHLMGRGDQHRGGEQHHGGEHEHREIATRAAGDDNHQWPTGLLELMQGLTNWAKRSERSAAWRADNIILPAGETRHVARERLQRARALVWADPTNTSPVWISPQPIADNPTGRNKSNAVPLFATSPVLELSTPGEIYAWASGANQSVYVIEEYLS